MNTILRAEKLGKQYQMGEVTIDGLRGVEVAVQEGEFLAIMGPSGSGKSTLLHLLGGLDGITSGEVYLHDTAYSTLSDDDLTLLRRQQIGFVFQFFNLLPTLTARENIALPLLISGASIADHAARLDDLLAMVGLTERAGHKPAQLSGGQQQRVAIARALVTQPAIVLADEPTGNLDSQAGEAVLGLMRRAKDEHGQTIVMVTHSAHAATFADRVVYLKDGQIVQESSKRNTQSIHAIMLDLEG